MNDNFENKEIDQLLRQMMPMKAPPKLKNNIMDQISAEQIHNTTAATMTIEKLLLGLSLLTAMIALLFMVDFGFIANGFTDAIGWMNTLLSSDQPTFDQIAETTAQLPAMALMVLVAIGLLLLVERLIIRRFTNVNYFV
jgi:membrane glycosyltransferase